MSNEKNISFELSYNQGSSGNAISHSFSNITVHQNINEHHSFEIRVRADVIEGKNDPIFQKSKESIGKKIKIEL
jgi:hypothetical protein